MTILADIRRRHHRSVTVNLTHEQYNLLFQLANERMTSLSQLVRELLLKQLSHHKEAVEVEEE